MSAEGRSNNENGVISNHNIHNKQGQDDEIEEQLLRVSKRLDNISALYGESSQLKFDALKCFGDNLEEMRKLQEDTNLKAEAFRNLVTTVGMAVGQSNSN